MTPFPPSHLSRRHPSRRHHSTRACSVCTIQPTLFRLRPFCSRPFHRCYPLLYPFRWCDPSSHQNSPSSHHIPFIPLIPIPFILPFPYHIFPSSYLFRRSSSHRNPFRCALFATHPHTIFYHPTILHLLYHFYLLGICVFS